MAVSRQIIEIAKAYNKYYYDHRILEGAEEEIRAKLLMTDAVRTVIKKGCICSGSKRLRECRYDKNHTLRDICRIIPLAIIIELLYSIPSNRASNAIQCSSSTFG